MSIEEVAQQLYGLAPEDFTSARNARVKEVRAAGEPELAAEVQALRKPTTGAWLLNQLVRRHGEEVQRVLELGAQLRAAQGTLSADELRGLDRQRRQLTRAVAGQARALGREAGRRVTDQVTADVEETLRSAMVDAAAGAALSTGLLTDTFSSTGIDPVDLSGVVALGGAPTRPERASSRTPPAEQAETPDPGHQRELAAAEEAVAQAESAEQEARAASGRAQEQATQARHLHERLEAERDELRRRLEDLDEQVATAATAVDAAAGAQEQAARAEAAAVEAAEELRRRLEALR